MSKVNDLGQTLGKQIFLVFSGQFMQSVRPEYPALPDSTSVRSGVTAQIAYIECPLQRKAPFKRICQYVH
ncbi:hypothetical protein D3C73_1212390 [compost metagenome]